MAKYRHRLPQLEGGLFLADGGLETTLIFHRGVDLRHFAAFDILRTIEGCEMLRDYFRPYIEAARANGSGFILDTPTWRASADWGSKLGYSREALAAVNRDAVAAMVELREANETPAMPMVVNGVIGPRGDGYVPGELMSVEEAQAYHSEQVEVFADTDADMLTAVTLTNVNEAIGIARAARAARMPVALSFTVETDGKLPTGDRLGDAIAVVDAATDGYPAYYMINCAHPTHFEGTLREGGTWLKRLRGIRANASQRSHAELNEAPDLDAGDPVELGAQYRALLTRFPQIRIVGGCCGTDHRHIACIGEACRRVAA
jgi:homocysteine S-methyltransferase